MNPFEMFAPERVVDLQGETKEEVLREMVDALATSPHVKDPKDLLAKVLERERTLSTGVGVGLAVPHVKIASVGDFVIGIGRSLVGVEFDSIDKLPVHIVVMIACNESQSGDYLKVLGKLVRVLKEPDFQTAVLRSTTPHHIVDIFCGPDGPFAR